MDIYIEDSVLIWKEKKCLFNFENLQWCIISFQKIVTSILTTCLFRIHLATHKPPQSSVVICNQRKKKQLCPSVSEQNILSGTFLSATWRLQLRSCGKKKNHDPRINTLSEIKQRNQYSHCSKTLESIWWFANKT